MLTSGSMVLIREGGARKPVDELVISDLVFDPWAQKYVEIVDILSRKVELEGDPDKHPLYPIQLRVGSVATGRPHENLLVSPSQVICCIECSSKASEMPVFQKYMASSLLNISEVKYNLHLKEVTYFAIFTEKKQIIDVSGIMLSTFCQDVFKAEFISSG